MTKNDKVIVLFSGGQDSTTCLFYAIEKYGLENVKALGFNYGQKHKQELVQAQLIAKEAKVEYQIIDLTGVLGGSSLTDHSKDVNKPHDINKSLPSSFTAGRNALFLTVAAGMAYNEGRTVIITGVCQTDYSGYPDCRDEFVKQMKKALCMAMDFYDLVIETPLMWLNKAETWGLAADLDKAEGMEDFLVLETVRTKTLTDYNGDTTMNEWGMGKEDNPASVLRAKGYREAKKLGLV